mmetsp:Transcript_30515/g.58808  ORF Transcript_30515/g.58808 Transcript_30515/m.58808 type:complete len:121 (-) Transcript_30515:73-435(-)
MAHFGFVSRLVFSTFMVATCFVDAAAWLIPAPSRVSLKSGRFLARSTKVLRDVDAQLVSHGGTCHCESIIGHDDMEDDGKTAPPASGFCLRWCSETMQQQLPEAAHISADAVDGPVRLDL